jgi:hypothetical protein
MDAEDTRSLALDGLARFLDAALSDPDTYARGPDGPAGAEAAIARIRARIEPSASANPEYAPMHEAASALVAFAATDPDAYGEFLAVVASAYRRGATSPVTLQGLLTMDDFLSAIGDDHEWAVDGSGTSPVVRPQADVAGHVPTLTLRSLRDAVLPLLDGPGATPSP